MAKREMHRLSKTPEHNTWIDMRSRCRNPRCKAYPDYGGRGITVDPRWDSFTRFLSDMGPKPSPAHSIDRIDHNGPYSPENCRWATQIEQANNTRANRFLVFAGKSQTIAQWAREIGVSEDTIEQRLRVLKWSVEKTLTTPHRGWGPHHRRAA